MKWTPDKLALLQKIELDSLRVFIDVCRRLDLRYYVLGGTMLGAVRHQGFIPWDDDIDVGMPREDYEIFLHRAQELLPDHIFLQTHDTDPEYPANFAKLRNSQTTFIESGLQYRNINHGIYIDIFPLDFYPDKGQLLFRAKNMLLKMRITDALSPGNERMKTKTKAVRLLSRFLYPSIPSAIKKRDVLFKSVTEGTRIANHCGAWLSKEIVPAQWYGEGVILPFEGLEVRAPSDYHAWLTQVYGDYMQLPPEEKRVGHHYLEAFDPDKSYTYYTRRS